MKKTTLVALTIIATQFAGCSSTSSDKVPASASTQRHATSPKHFWFDSTYQPSPGKRYWTAVGQTWIEQYESGIYSQFRVVWRTTIEGTSGSVVVKVTGAPDQTGAGNVGNFQVFIPDVGSTKMKLWFHHKINGEWQDWRFLAEMQDIE